MWPSASAAKSGGVIEVAAGSRCWFTAQVRVSEPAASKKVQVRQVEELSSDDSAAKDDVDEAACCEALARLLKLLADSDADSLAWCSTHAELLARLGGRGEALLQAVRDFDFEQALDLLEHGC
ncbi:MAG: hypothetical protein RJA36_1690 [Pseudomonadota bacterium]